MKAIAVTPLQMNSLRLIDSNLDRDQVLVKVVETGVCRTDLEIIDGLYGEAPEGYEYLILGHESLGKIVETNGDFRKDDYVVRMVRRSCSKCVNCSSGYVDMCSTGNYTEAGIKGVQGVMAEYYSDKEENLILIPEEQIDVGVLLEPLSVCEKSLYQAFKIQERLIWNPKKALVIGAGPIGLLESMLLRLKEIDTFVVAKSLKGNEKSRIVEAIGAHYISTEKTHIRDFLAGEYNFDYIFEASGNAKVIPLIWKNLANNGVLCLSSITPEKNNVIFPMDLINLQTVLGNKVVFGAVNANIRDYKRGVKRFAEIKKRWPSVLERIITKRLHVDNFRDAFEKRREDIKTTISF